MKILKRVLALSFLSLMIGVPLLSVSSQLTEAEAAVYTPVLKIRYLDKTGGDYETGVYHDDTSNANGSANEENSTLNQCIEVEFCDRGVKDPYNNNKVIKLSSSEYKEVVTNLKKLESAPLENNRGVQNDGAYDGDGNNKQGKDVRYITWYQFDKKKSANNYFQTEGYYVTPRKIKVSGSTSEKVNSIGPDLYIERQVIGGTTYIGKDGQEWEMTIFAMRYDYFMYKFQGLSKEVKEDFKKTNDRTVLYLQPAIGIYKNKTKVDTCYDLQSWVNALNWANSSTFDSHYNVKVVLNSTNSELLFVHYIQEGSYDANDVDGTPVVDESNVDKDWDRVYSKYNYTPNNRTKNEKVGIPVASSATFAYGEGPFRYGTQKRVEIFKPEIRTTVTNDDGEEEEQLWVISGAHLIYSTDFKDKKQSFHIKFSNLKDGSFDFDAVDVIKDDRDKKFESNKNTSKGKTITYDEFLDYLGKSKVTTASAGETIVFFEYALSETTPVPYKEEDHVPEGDEVKIEYQYQTFNSQGEVVWKKMKPDEYEKVPDNRAWKGKFDKLGTGLYQYYGIYSVHATDTKSGKLLVNALTNKTTNEASNFYDTAEWEAEADSVRKVAYNIPKYTDKSGPVTVTVRYAARMPHENLRNFTKFNKIS